MKSDADHSSWRIRSCVCTDRDDKGRQLQHTSLTLGKAMIALRIKGRQSLCRQSALPRPIQGETINAVIIRQTGNTPGANNPSSKKRETIGTLVSINGSHSRRGKGVGWVAFPPPHITVCFFSHRCGRASHLRQPPSHCGARAPRVDRAQDGIIEKETAAGQGNMDSRKIASNS